MKQERTGFRYYAHIYKMILLQNLKSKMSYRADFIKYCFRSLNLFFYFISEVFDGKGLGQFVFGLGTVIYAWDKLAIPVTLITVIEMILDVISASLFMIALMNFAAGAGFGILGGTSVMILMFKFKDYARYPITIFNKAFQAIFTFLIPMGYMAYYPSLLFY